MVWPYLYGCNRHYGAEGDNSMKQFGTSRRPSRIQGKATEKHTSVVKYTPAAPHETAMRAAQPLPVTQLRRDDASANGIRQEKSDRATARLNARAYPELSVMHGLSKGRLPSKRLRFHFPDLFPEVRETEEVAAGRIYYQEPAKLVNTESLLRWMVPSVPWRYLQNRHSPSSVMLPKDTQTTQLETAEDLPREADSVPKRQPRLEGGTKRDVGCQTMRDKGVQFCLEQEEAVDGSASPDRRHKHVIVVEGDLCGYSVRRVDAAVQTEILQKPVTVFKRSPKRHRVRKTRPGGSGKAVLESKPRPPANADAVGATPVCEPLVGVERTPPGETVVASRPLSPLKALTEKHASPRLQEETDFEPRRRPLQPTPSPPTPQETVTVETNRRHTRPVLSVTQPNASEPKDIPAAEIPSKEGIDEAAPRPTRGGHSAKNTPQTRPARKGASYRLTLSANDPQKAEKIENSTGAASVKSIESVSVGSTVDSLEELERLIETQHAQLVAKGFLPPDTELEHVLADTSESNPNEENPIDAATGCQDGSNASENAPTMPIDKSDGSMSDVSSHSSLYDASLSKLMESLGMSISEAPIAHPSSESSDLERSAAAIAALTSYQSQLDASLDDEVVYEVSISKDSDG